MKKIILTGGFSLLFFFVISTFSFGQSVTISPNTTVNNSVAGDNYLIKSNQVLIGIQGLRFNGTLSSKTPVVSGDAIFRIGAGGNVSSSTERYESGMIKFEATENWSSSGSGSKMSFFTTNNGATSSTEKLTIGNDGKIGVGTSSPSAFFHVLSPSALVATFGSSTSFSYLNFNTNGSTATGYVGTYNENAINSIEIGTHAFNTTGKVFLSTNATPRLTVMPSGFIKLGDDAATPAIKMKKLTGTTSATQGTSVTVAHGVSNPTKILSVRVMIDLGIGITSVPDGFNKDNGYECNVWVNGSNVQVENKAGNSASILSKPYTVLVIYEE